MPAIDVRIPVGSTHMPAYFASPDDTKPHVAVIVLQEIFGINTEMRRITDLLASAGYAALAINYYHRTDPELNLPYNEEGMKAGMAAASKVSRATFRMDIEASMSWLNDRPEVVNGAIAAWGFCMGGSFAFLSATIPGIKAAVCFYGGNLAAPFANGEPEAIADTPSVQAPLFLAFGGKDHFITPDKVERIRTVLIDADKPFEIKVYPDQDHGFFRQSSQALETPDLADAWSNVQRFLDQVRESASA